MFRYCIILAAGKGMRLMPLTEFHPKAMIEVNNTPVIYHSLSQVRSIDNLIVTVGYLGYQTAKYVLEEGATMILDTRSRGNAYWIFNTLLKYLNEPILVLTCDNIVKIDINWIETEYKKHAMPPCLVIPVNPVKGISGDYIIGKDNVVKKLSRSRLVRDDKMAIYCSGIQVVNPYVINQIVNSTEDFYEVWSELITINQLYYSSVYPYPWFSINTPQQLNQYNAKSFI